MNLRVLFISLTVESIFMGQVCSQASFRFGPEAGLTITESQARTPMDYGKKLETVSPSFGLNGVVKLTRHFEVYTGFKYETFGFTLKDEKYNFHSTLVYKKLSLPIKACLVMGKKRMKTVLFTGCSPGYFLSGTYDEIDLLNRPDIPYRTCFKPDKHSTQYIIGFGMETNHLAFNFSYSIGGQLKSGYSWSSLYKYGFTTRVSYHNYIYILDNDDFSISVSYLFQVKKRNKEEVGVW